MARQVPVEPVSCPDGFLGRYVVSQGDTLYMIAQMFRVRLEALYANNHHIPDPNYLIPGDVLCVPSMVPIPCCVELQKKARLTFGAGAVAYAHFGPRGGQAISVLAQLPAPSTLGNFDMYITTAYIGDIGGFGNELFPTPEDPPTWASRIELPTAASLTPDTRITIQPSNSQTGIDGPVLFENTLQECDCRCRQKQGNQRRVLLTGTESAPEATGMVTLTVTPARIQLAAMNLPRPESLGSSFHTYRAWVIDAQTQNRFRMDLQRTNNNLWLGQASGGSLAGFDEIRVTAEPIPGATSPTGPTVLTGNLNC